MEFRNCKYCNKPFQYSGIGPVLCPTCKKKDEENFNNVKKYLLEHPQAQGTEVSEKTGVPVQIIAKWMREEKLFISGVTGILKCEQCGKPISAGKLCVDCKRRLALGFIEAGMGTKKVERPIHVKTNQGMQFLKRH